MGRSICNRSNVPEKSHFCIICIIRLQNMSKIETFWLLSQFIRYCVLGSIQYRILCKYIMGRGICNRSNVPEKSHFCIISIITRQNMSKIESFRLLSYFSRLWVIGSVWYRILCKCKMGRSICNRPQVQKCFLRKLKFFKNV